MTTLTYIPSWALSQDVEFKVKRVQFGDGYSQRVQLGINSAMPKWQVSFQDRTDTEADAIVAFFTATKGVSSFDWTPPGGVAAKFVVPAFKRTYDVFNSNTVSAVLEQVIE